LAHGRCSINVCTMNIIYIWLTYIYVYVCIYTSELEVENGLQRSHIYYFDCYRRIFFEIESHYLAQAIPKLFQSSKCWDYRHITPWWAL
jgi:hypothetical protein